jgi:hypothetical protein
MRRPVGDTLTSTCHAFESWEGFTHSLNPLYENDVIEHVLQKLPLCLFFAYQDRKHSHCLT